jgi:hypothetical protein
MTSAIDDTLPVTGNPTTASVRGNFTTAKAEISALQADVETLQGQVAVTHPAPMIISASRAIDPTSNQSILIYNDTGAVLDLQLAVGHFAEQTIRIKDCGGNAGTMPIRVLAPAGYTIDGLPAYPIFSNYGSIELFWAETMWGTR